MQKLTRKSKFVALAAASAAGVLVFGSSEAHAQLTLSGTSYTQTFDSVGSGLPTGWVVSTGASATTLGTSQAFTTTATDWSSTTGSFKNYASADGLTSVASGATQSSSTDRVIGVRTTGAFGDSSAAFSLQLASTTNLSNFSLSFVAQMLSVQTRSQTWNLQYGLGATPTSFTTLATYSDPGAFGSTTISVGAGALSAIENQSGPVWIRFVVLAASSGSGSRDTVGIDDFSLTFTNSGGGPKDLTWTAASNTNWDTATQNFLDSLSAPSAFTDGDTVTFGNTGVGTVNIVPTTVAPGSLAFTNTAGTYTLTGGAITGSTGLSKSGAGSLVLMNTNTYTGLTEVTGGTLSFGVNDALLSTGGLVVNGADAVADIGSTSQTLGGVTLTSGQIIGSGTLTAANYAAAAGTLSASLAGASSNFTKSTAGTVVLSGTNSYGGITSITGGTLQLGSAGALPSGGNVVISGTSTFDIGSQSVTAGTITVTSGHVTGSGSINASSVIAGAGSISGASLVGSGTFTKSISNTFTVYGTHSYTGATTVQSGGTLVLDGTLGNTAMTVAGTLRTAGTATTAGTVDVMSSGVLNIGGTGAAGVFNAGAMSFAGGSTLQFDLGTNTDLIDLGSNALTVGGGAVINYTGVGIVAGNTYTLFETTSFVGVDFTTGTKPGGLGTATYNFTGTEYTVTFTSAPKGLGANPYSFTAHDARYRQSFDSLSSTGTGTHASLPTGWTVVETGTGANTTYTAGNGGSTSGDSYSLGSTGNSERALGQLRSGSVTTVMGFNVKNDTGSAIDQIEMEYVGEQWRLGTSGRADKLDFQYSTTASSLTEGSVLDGTWVDFDALDFTAPISTGTVGALDGNDPANQLLIQGLISGLNVLPGDGIWFRWVDLDATSSDDALGIDSVTFVPEPASLSLLAMGSLGLLRRRRRRLATV